MPTQQKTLLPLSFEKGLDESQEDSLLAEGMASVLENWIPEPNGALRCRRGWLNSATTSAPGTRKARGIGYFRIAAQTATPARVQIAQNITSTATTAVSWPTPTTARNLLLLIVAYDGTNTPSVPAGWSVVVNKLDGAGRGLYIYAKQDAASESGSVSVTSTGAARLSVQIAEYSGIEVSSATDKTASASGTSTTPQTGTTATTTRNIELWIGAVADFRDETMSAPTNSFSIVQQQGVLAWHTGMLERITTATGTANTQVTTATSDAWMGVIATFKARNITAANNVVVANQDSSTQYTLYYHDVSDLTTGAWTSIESVTVEDSLPLMGYAQGLSSLLYATRYFATTRRWDGAVSQSIAGSPAGRAIVFHKNRFFVAGTADNPTRLWYSDLGSYSTWGATSYIDIGKDDGEAILDLAVFEEGLLIAKEGSLWFLSGSGPDDFTVHPLNAGNAYAGRSIAITPYGAVVAGTRQIWRWGGGGVQLISKPVEESYALAGDFVTTAYIDGTTYVCDEGTGTMFCLDMERGVWWTEKLASPTTEGPACISAKSDKLYYGPQAGTTISLAAYRQLPGTARSRDAGLAETFLAYTPEIWPEDPGRTFSPYRLYLKYRQRGGNATMTGLTVTPVYNGTPQTPIVIAPQATAGTYRKSLTIKTQRGIYSALFRFSQANTTSDSALIDIEEAVLELDGIVRRPRG